ncbi:MAG: FHA domain-containing protein [Myxococcales bacterium]|nr:FHA domain-containing protein [Myxococcales bacterium]
MAELHLRLRGRLLRRLEIDKHRITVGRDPTCDMVIENPSVSRVHLYIEMTDTGFTVTDQGSANGTYVNGYRVRSHPLQDGDEVQLGKFMLHYVERSGGSFVVTPEQRKRQSEQVRDPASTLYLSHKEISGMIDEGEAPPLPDQRTEDYPTVLRPPQRKSNSAVIVLSILLLLTAAGLITLVILWLSGRLPAL